MRVVSIEVESLSPYTQSRGHQEPKLDREAADDYESRTWRSRMHVDENGNVFIPAMQFINAIQQAAKRLSLKIPGRGQATYTKHFVSGIMMLENLTLPIKAKDVIPEVLFVPSDGVKGSGKRVRKTFGVIPKWSGTIEVTVMDDTITPSVFEQVFKEAGMYIGIGFWRPANGGLKGRFAPKKFDW